MLMGTIEENNLMFGVNVPSDDEKTANNIGYARRKSTLAPSPTKDMPDEPPSSNYQEVVNRADLVK